MDKRREALKELLRARNKDYSVYKTEKDKVCENAYKELCEKYGDSFDITDLTDVDTLLLPEGFFDWYEHGDSALFEAAIDNDFLEERLDELNNPTLEDVIDIIRGEDIGLTDIGLYYVFSYIADTKSSELWNHDLIHKLMTENAMAMLDVEVIEMLGEAYGKLGISVDELPTIGMQDTSFLRGYLDNFPVNGKIIIEEGHPEYGQYIELYNLVKRVQSELDLKHQKEEQDELNGRIQKIAEAEDLVNREQSQQQE